MRFYTSEECAAWCRDHSVALDERSRPTRELTQPFRFHCLFPPTFPQLLFFSRCIESTLRPSENCLVWITDHGIFPSNENHHLYYRLRQSYGDGRLLHEAPGHLCLDYEQPEVVTLIYLCLLFGWDAHLLPSTGYSRAFISHNEWAQVDFVSESLFNDTRHSLEAANVEVSTNFPA